MLLALDFGSLPWPELGARHCQLPRCDSQNLVFCVGHCIIWSSRLNMICAFLAPLPSELVLPSGHLVARWSPAVPGSHQLNNSHQVFPSPIVPAKIPDESEWTHLSDKDQSLWPRRRNFQNDQAWFLGPYYTTLNVTEVLIQGEWADVNGCSCSWVFSLRHDVW